MLVTVFPDNAPLKTIETGLVASEIVPFPSCPKELLPQQTAEPTEVTAQVFLRLAEIPTTDLPASAPPVIATGEVARGPLDPLPSCPSSLLPQHAAIPSSVTAHVRTMWTEIPAICFPAKSPAATETGKAEPATPPLPSCPKPPSPQQAMLLSDNKAHEWSLPAEILVTVFPTRAPFSRTTTAVLDELSVPLPSW